MEQRVLGLEEEDHMEEPLMNSPQSFDSLSGSSSRIQSTPPQLLVINSIQGLEAIQHLPTLGLKLSMTPSFMDKLERLARKQNSRAHDQQLANYNSGNYAATTKVKSSKDISNKLKAENFSISLLKVGSWQRVTRNEGDLIAKFYFAKRKLVWEILEKGLKSKIEIQWSEILSLKAILLEDRPGILQIELNQPPSFHHEIDPQPRKHTQWRMASDFTGGQALTFRRHYLEFPCGVLDKPLEKLLSCDSRLFQISRQGFPATNSPYFQPQTNGIGFSLDFGGLNQQQQQQQFSFSHYVPQHYQTYDQQQKSLNKDSPISDEQSSNNQMSLWSQGMNNVRDSLIINQVGSAMAAAAPNIPQVTSLPSNHMQQLAGGLLPTHSLQEADDQSQSRFQSLLNDVQEMLMSNSQTQLSNPTGNNVIAAGYGHETMVMKNNWSSNVPQLPSWQVPPPQPDQINPHDNMSMNHHLPGNNPFCCPSDVSNDPSGEYFPSANSFNEVNDWSWRSG